MVRTKIEINISALKQRSRVMNIIIGSTTTTTDVLCKVLEKCRVRDPPDKYQLWATAKDKSRQGIEIHVSHEPILSHAGPFYPKRKRVGGSGHTSTTSVCEDTSSVYLKCVMRV